jgi:hypothetical protein
MPYHHTLSKIIEVIQDENKISKTGFFVSLPISRNIEEFLGEHGPLTVIHKKDLPVLSEYTDCLSWLDEDLFLGTIAYSKDVSAYTLRIYPIEKNPDNGKCRYIKLVFGYVENNL